MRLAQVTSNPVSKFTIALLEHFEFYYNERENY